MNQLFNNFNGSFNDAWRTREVTVDELGIYRNARNIKSSSLTEWAKDNVNICKTIVFNGFCKKDNGIRVLSQSSSTKVLQHVKRVLKNFETCNPSEKTRVKQSKDYFANLLAKTLKNDRTQGTNCKYIVLDGVTKTSILTLAQSEEGINYLQNLLVKSEVCMTPTVERGLECLVETSKQPFTVNEIVYTSNFTNYNVLQLLAVIFVNNGATWNKVSKSQFVRNFITLSEAMLFEENNTYDKVSALYMVSELLLNICYQNVKKTKTYDDMTVAKNFPLTCAVIENFFQLTGTKEILTKSLQMKLLLKEVYDTSKKRKFSSDEYELLSFIVTMFVNTMNDYKEKIGEKYVAQYEGGRLRKSLFDTDLSTYLDEQNIDLTQMLFDTEMSTYDKKKMLMDACSSFVLQSEKKEFIEQCHIKNSLKTK